MVMMYLSSHFCKVKQNLKVDNIMIERSHGVISEDVWPEMEETVISVFCSHPSFLHALKVS